MASEKQLKVRMKAVGNIKKITRAMKMVAAAKLRRSQEALETARQFSKALTAAWPDPTKKTGEDAKAAADAAAASTGKKAIIGITSDRGLCGAVNSVVIRAIKAKFNAADKTNAPTIVLFGEKSRAGLERTFGQYFGFAITEQTKLKRYTFKQAMIMSDLLSAQKLDDGVLFYNYFKSLLSFETREVAWPSFASSTADVNTFVQYDVEGDDDFFENFYLFRNAVRLFHFFAETDTSEYSSRMNSMGGSTKNAGEMLDRLRLKYNRTRQARITTELTEIISGAVALE
jgi:F-type H+-transporting ATPase subunit gamma